MKQFSTLRKQASKTLKSIKPHATEAGFIACAAAAGISHALTSFTIQTATRAGVSIAEGIQTARNYYSEAKADKETLLANSLASIPTGIAGGITGEVAQILNRFQ